MAWDKKKTNKEPDVGIGYRITYKDKQTGEDGNFMRLMLRVDELQKLDTKDGMVYVSVFPLNVKERKENTPDFVVKKAITREKPAEKKESKGRAGLPF